MIRTLCFLSLVLVSYAAPLSAAERPNILFIAVDDLNDWIGCLGGHPQAHTPNIDRLAARGTLFTNAHCQSPLCNSSRTSLMTGLRPSSTGMYGLAPWFRNVPELAERVSLTQCLRAAGYHTMKTGKIYHGGFPPQKDRADEFHTYGPESSVGFKLAKKIVPAETPDGNHPLMDWGPTHAAEDYGDYQVASWAVEQLEAASDEPFFLAVGFFLPHVPCYAPPEYFERLPLAEVELPPFLANDRDDTPRFSWYTHWRLPEPRYTWLEKHDQWKPLVQAYLASTTFMDAQVGRVLEALERSGKAENTVVVLWSDHGWHLGEKRITGKNTLWNESTRVPMIFAGPGIAPGAVCNRPAELLDLYPTLAELAGAEPPADLEGHSLVPQLKNAKAERPWPAITTHNQGNHTIRTEQWRYIRYADGSEELYDEAEDFNEWRNLAGEAKHAALLAEFREQLPKIDKPPAPGSAHRILTWDGETAVWEGKPIGENDPVE